MTIHVSVIILAKNEAKNVRRSLFRLLRQTLFKTDGIQAEIVFLANGCDDNTAQEARTALAELLDSDTTTYVVEDLQLGGKSRSWNRAVHEFANPDADFLLFVDADVGLVDENVLSELVATLRSDEQLHVVTGRPMKATAAKPKLGPVEKLSLSISRHTEWRDAICGSLYVGRAEILRNYVLPDTTPGEDGFLNALVTTEGFVSQEYRHRVLQLRRPTHYFEAVKLREFVSHERRMIVGTLINNWTFEALHAREKKEPIGSYIDGLNRSSPDWMNDIVRNRVAGQYWVIPKRLFFRRFARRHERRSLGARIVHYALASVATIVSMPSMVLANKTLRASNPASFW